MERSYQQDKAPVDYKLPEVAPRKSDRHINEVSPIDPCPTKSTPQETPSLSGNHGTSGAWVCRVRALTVKRQKGQWIAHWSVDC